MMRSNCFRYRFYYLVVCLPSYCVCCIRKRVIDRCHVVDDPILYIILKMCVGLKGVGDVLKDKHHLACS